MTNNITNNQASDLYQTVLDDNIEQFIILLSSYVKTQNDIERVKRWLRQLNLKKDWFDIVRNRELNIKRLNKLTQFK